MFLEMSRGVRLEIKDPDGSQFYFWTLHQRCQYSETEENIWEVYHIWFENDGLSSRPILCGELVMFDLSAGYFSEEQRKICTNCIFSDGNMSTKVREMVSEEFCFRKTLVI